MIVLLPYIHKRMVNNELTSQAKGRQFTVGKVINRLFGIDPCTYLAIYRY